MKFVSLKKGITYVAGRKVMIVLYCCIFLMTYCGTQYICNGKLAHLRVKFNYEEAAKGLNPNKTRFNASKLLSDEVLQKAIEKGGFDISAEELSRCLELSSSFDEAQINTDSNRMNIATEYHVVCNPAVFQYNIDANELLNLLADAYYEEYLKHFSENDSILDLTYENLENLDYMDIDNYLEMKARKLQHYIVCYNSENPTYRMEDSGESFSSLAEKIDTFINVELERLRSYILENGLSKSSEEYITRLNYQNRLLQVEYEKNMASYDVRLETINLYDEQMARIVLVPTNDENLEYYMSRTKIGADYFANEANLSLNNATAGQEQMEHNDYAENQIRNSGAGQNVYGKADNMIEQLKSELDILSQQSKDIADAYIQQKRNGYVKIDMVRNTRKERLNLKSGIINTAIFGMMLCAYMAAKYLRDEEEAEKRN